VVNRLSACKPCVQEAERLYRRQQIEKQTFLEVCYYGLVINKLQIGVIVSFFFIQKIHFVGNFIQSTGCDFSYNYVSTTKFINIKCGEGGEWEAVSVAHCIIFKYASTDLFTRWLHIHYGRH